MDRKLPSAAALESVNEYGAIFLPRPNFEILQDVDLKIVCGFEHFREDILLRLMCALHEVSGSAR